MSSSSSRPARPSRRTLLAGSVAAAAATGIAAAPAVAAPRPHGHAPLRVMGHDVDVSLATPELSRFFASYFEAKSGTDVDALMAHFARESVTYADATVGWIFRDWQSLYDQFASLLGSWPESAYAYPTRIIGDLDSAVVFFTDSPELFGHEIRAVGTVDFRHGKVTRWVDHWDGRSLTVDGVAALRTPLDRFPTDFGEHRTGGNASPALRSAVRDLTTALAAGDATRAARLLDPDVVVADIALHTLVTGRERAAAFFARTLPTLPYGRGVTVRHVVGSARGGAFEWISRSRLPLGATVLELGRDRLITRMTSVWDSALWPDAAVGSAQAATILG